MAGALPEGYVVTNNDIVKDAKEFGVHVKQGGWRLGLLVARNVEKGTAGRPRAEIGTRVPISKVSATEFAKQAGTSQQRVMRHLSAWELAAADGHVPPAHTLAPGADVALDTEDLGDWSDYYTSVRSLDGRSPRHREAIQKAAAEEGTTPEQVQRASASAPAIAAAIKADPRIAETAARALDEKANATTPPAPKPEKKAQPLDLITEFRTLHRNVERLMNLVLAGNAVVTDGQKDALRDEVRWLRSALDHIETALNSRSFDEALADLLAEG